jgi:hypothetical protein
MPGIMDFFRAQPVVPNNTQQQTQGQPNTQSNQQQQTQPNTQANPAVANNGNHSNTTTPNQPVNPLDAYAKMYDNASKATPDAPPSFALDQETVSKVSSSLDFTKDLPPELMTKALAGDAQAMIQAMNHVARGAYQTSLQHQSLLTDKFVGARLEHDGKTLSSKVKSELTSSALASAPNYQHPVVKAELTRIAKMIQAEHPDASPAQIAESAQKYLFDIKNALTPEDPNAGKTPAGQTDWDAYFK